MNGEGIMEKTGSLIISWSVPELCGEALNDSAVLIVGTKADNKIIVLNTFQGQEAFDIYNAIINGGTNGKQKEKLNES